MPDSAGAETQAYGRSFVARRVTSAAAFALGGTWGPTEKQPGKDGCPNVKR